MYPSSTSSSSQGSIGNSSSGGGGLMRYGSAPSSLFTNAVDSVIGATRDFSTLGPQTRFFPSESSESTPMPNLNDTVPRTDNHNTTTQPSYRFPPPPPPPPPAASNLVRHSSLPTGFLNQLASSSAAADNGFSITRVIGNYDFNGSSGGRLDSQHSFTRQLDHESLSRMGTHHHQNNAAAAAANNDEDVIIRTTSDHDHHINNNVQRNSAYNNQNINNNNNNNMRANWDDSNSKAFSTTVAPSSKRSAKTTFRNDNMESQFQFCMPEAALEMATMENLLYNNNNNSNIPQDSIPCKIRAKRGFATHPRSIAERERRTRISGKLKKLQDLVPNMDKQTSYSDMLDLAVQHIKTLQNQLQKLNKENDSCMCGCKIKISSPENT